MVDEFDLIASYFRPLTSGVPEAFGLTDDAAMIPEIAGQRLVVSTDTIVSGVHFLADDIPQNVAAKLCGSNLSDLAAMGARPAGFTLSCAWPKDIEQGYIAAFAEALNGWCRAHSFPLLGGDTVATDGPMVLTMTVFGHVAETDIIRRNGARPGDRVYVTGTIGDAALGLLVAKDELQCSEPVATFLENRYRQPIPRVKTGIANAGKVKAGIDISDGLVQDLGHVAIASGVQIVLNADKVPLSDAAAEVLARDPGLLEPILGGGDDYELVFCGEAAPICVDVPITEIGTVEKGTPGVVVVDSTGRSIEISTTGFNHFSAENRQR